METNNNTHIAAENSARETAEIRHALNMLAQCVHMTEREKGWWPPASNAERERLAAFVANVHGELSELWEAFRVGALLKAYDNAIIELEESEDFIVCGGCKEHVDTCGDCAYGILRRAVAKARGEE